MNVTRRNFMLKVGIGAMSGVGLLGATKSARAESCPRVNGSGSYRLGPYDPVKTGDDPVFLITDLGFDETMVFCKVTTNFAAFRFPTAKMGVIELGAYSFAMEMESVSMDPPTIKNEVGSDGPVASFNGVLRSETRIFSGGKLNVFTEDRIGFGCTATQLNSGAKADVSKNNFEMVVRFNPAKEQAAIFGEQPKFCGQLIKGNIIVVA